MDSIYSLSLRCRNGEYPEQGSRFGSVCKKDDDGKSLGKIDKYDNMEESEW